jgi:hypothetical protein
MLQCSIHMLQKYIDCYTCCNGTHLPQPLAAAAGAPPSVTMRAAKASRRIRGGASTSEGG